MDKLRNVSDQFFQAYGRGSAQHEGRRNSEKDFAKAHGWHQEFKEEQSFVPDNSGMSTNGTK